MPAITAAASHNNDEGRHAYATWRPSSSCASSHMVTMATRPHGISDRAIPASALLAVAVAFRMA